MPTDTITYITDPLDGADYRKVRAAILEYNKNLQSAPLSITAIRHDVMGKPPQSRLEVEGITNKAMEARVINIVDFYSPETV